MLEKGKISVRQFTILVTLYLVGSAILIIPSILASKAKQDAWIAAIAAVCLSLLIIPLYIALGKRFPNMTFAEYSEVILGRWLGKVAIALFLIYVFVSAALTLRNIGDFMTTQIMQDTPIQAVHILFMIVVVMGVKLGLEPLARAAELFFPFIVLLIIILVLLIAPQMKMVNLQPVLDEGFFPVLKATIAFSTFPFLGSVTFLMIFPAVNRIEKAGKALFIGVLLAGVILTVIAVVGISVIGADHAARSSFPSYEIARRINIGDFLERIEAIMAIIWFLTIFFRLSIMHYVLSLGIAQTLRLSQYQVLAIPLGVFIIPFSIFLVPNTTYLSTFNKITLPVFIFTIALLLPLLLLIVAVFRKKRGPKIETDNRVSGGG
ncbi:GerAB/ArcD/ProY family transporter [Paenibacillus eucommiae]|uniref:Spore germination protein KB n=1 Tax=Paenibacillus eucommiae TaxID=1355755 RepID=A0ABS4IXD5_9BACL|nr:endospore germination permease [Paenibacillus eucommiae]MBP1992239.1 spore germination protein KB [Paenibacillus eucommiae]